jgi:tRNA A37 threonylcarbamoyladenosine biosynthesis protein TsaE
MKVSCQTGKLLETHHIDVYRLNELEIGEDDLESCIRNFKQYEILEFYNYPIKCPYKSCCKFTVKTQNTTVRKVIATKN